MSQSITVLGASRAQLFDNTRKALEVFQKGRPVSRDALNATIDAAEEAAAQAQPPALSIPFQPP